MVKYSEDDVIEAHKASFNNMEKLRISQKCGCFYCLEIFCSDEIEEYIDDKPYGTAVCPYCNIDSVLGEDSGYQITKEFMKAMKRYWFDEDHV